MSRYSQNRGINDIARLLVGAGFTPFRGGRHYRLKSPCGKVTVTVPGTPSGPRVEVNFRAQVRRHLKAIGMELTV